MSNNERQPTDWPEEPEFVDTGGDIEITTGDNPDPEVGSDDTTNDNIIF